METQNQNISDYAGIIKRRKNYFLIPFLSILFIAVGISFILPDVYKSTSTILIEGQQIPSDFVRSTVMTAVEETIQTITQQVMSRRKLLEIINRFGLYHDRRARETSEEIVERMREDIHLETISADIIDQRTGRPSMATIAFSLSYQGKYPEKVQKVSNVLASLYLEQNLKDRAEKARITSSFINVELKSLGENIDQLENKVAQFKEKHLHSLPEMAQLNFQMYQRLEQELIQLDQQLRNTKERKIYLEGQLAGVDPDLPGIKTVEGKFADAGQRLEYLNTEYVSLKASLSKKHPDLIKIKKEIESLEKEVGLKKKIEMKQGQLEKMKTDLSSLRAVFSPRHPDVIKLKKSIKILDKDLEDLRKEKTDGGILSETPENPAYINLKTQIATTKMEINNLKESRKKVRNKLGDYLKRLELTPQIEREYQLLTRDYENARIRYQETLHKLMEAETAEGLERSQKGQKFTIVDPAIYPEKPFKPNRAAIIMIGFILAMGGGVGVVSFKEFSDQSVWSETVLRQITDKPILATIPFILTDSDRLKQRRKIIITVIALGICSVLLVLAVHFFYLPLDVLWFKFLRKMG